MPDPIDDALAELGLDTPDPTHLANLWGTLFAEPDVLAQWAKRSKHPRLAAAYHALHQRVGARREDVRTAVANELGRDRVDSATEAVRSEAADIELELSRLKWLHGHRTLRLAASQALGDRYDRAPEEQEADVLRDLLQSAGRGLC